MLFYEVCFDIRNTEINREMNASRKRSYERDCFFDHSCNYQSKLCDLNSSYNQRFNEEKNAHITIFDLSADEMRAAVAVDDLFLDVRDSVKCIQADFPGAAVSGILEITCDSYAAYLTRAYNNDFSRGSARSVFDNLGIYYRSRSIFDVPDFQIIENVVNDNGIKLDKCLDKAEDIMASDSFKDELKRIYSKKNRKVYCGHPVHYLISAGDYSAAMDMVDIMIPALRKNKRIVGGRVVQMRKIKNRAHRDENFECFFSSLKGCVIVIDFSGVDEYGNYTTGYVDLANALGKMLERYGKDTLFIFVDVSGRSEITGAAISSIQSNADMIHITEGYGDHDMALAYMKRIAERAEFSYEKDEELTRYLPEKASYTVTDVYEAFNHWYSKGLKTHVYRAYENVETAVIKVAKPEDAPYERLMNMIGLADVKKVCDQIINTCKMEQIRQSMGLETKPISKHMLFAGNPGTAKTTVARLLAQILKREGVLTNGHIVECGRQDLVGKYVGWTAQIVQQKFREARGGILFIDEAYSLVDDSRSFGAEAINTIVQQMENYRDEVMVIFAGYTEKMRNFLAQNEGLNSRISFHLNFPDYSCDELMGILDLMLKDQGFKIDEQARAKCMGIFSMARSSENYGNGRFVRNLLDQARLRQSNRLVHAKEGCGVTKSELTRLTAEDFEMPFLAAAPSRHIGFDC